MTREAYVAQRLAEKAERERAREVHEENHHRWLTWLRQHNVDVVPFRHPWPDDGTLTPSDVREMREEWPDPWVYGCATGGIKSPTFDADPDVEAAMDYLRSQTNHDFLAACYRRRIKGGESPEGKPERRPWWR